MNVKSGAEWHHAHLDGIADLEEVIAVEGVRITTLGHGGLRKPQHAPSVLSQGNEAAIGCGGHNGALDGLPRLDVLWQLDWGAGPAAPSTPSPRPAAPPAPRVKRSWPGCLLPLCTPMQLHLSVKLSVAHLSAVHLLLHYVHFLSAAVF